MAGALTLLQRLLERVAPKQKENVLRALTDAGDTGLEHAVLGPLDADRALTQSRRGDFERVSVDRELLKRALAEKRGAPFLDFHTHLGTRVAPSNPDLRNWSTLYTDQGRPYQFMIGAPSRNGTPASFNWFETERPQLLTPERYMDAYGELARSRKLKGALQDVLRGHEEKDVEPLNLLARYLLMRHDAAKGRGRVEQFLPGQLSPTHTWQQVVEEIAPESLEILRKNKFGSGGRVGGTKDLKSRLKKRSAV